MRGRIGRSDVPGYAYLLYQPQALSKAGQNRLRALHSIKELGGGWALLSRLYVLAPVRWIEDRLYRWVAEHRPLLSRLWGTKPPFDEPKTPS